MVVESNKLCMCYVCAGVVTPRILFCCSRSLFFLYKQKILLIDIQAIHKLKINLSNILATRHANVQVITKEDHFFDFVHHSS
jgi:hypothetical protein